MVIMEIPWNRGFGPEDWKIVIGLWMEYGKPSSHWPLKKRVFFEYL